MAESSSSRVSEQQEAHEATAVTPPASSPAPPVGNRELARAVSELPARPRGRGLTSDRGVLARQIARTSAARRQIARLTHKVTTTQGEFTIDNYDLHEDAAGDVQKKCGINIDVKFESPTSLRSNKIGFVQVMKVTKDGTPYLFGNEKPRATGTGSGDEGWTVDRLSGKTQGYYGMNDDLNASNTNYWAGTRTDDTTATDAKMHDKVSLSRSPAQEIDCQAMTYAVDIEHGVYLGGFSWGWSIDKAGTLAAKAVASAAMGDTQRAAIVGWNKQAALSDTAKRNAAGQAKLPVPADPGGKKPWYKRVLPWNW